MPFGEARTGTETFKHKRTAAKNAHPNKINAIAKQIGQKLKT